MKNQYCSTNKMNKLKIDPCRDIYISEKYLLINWTSLGRKNLTSACFLFQKEIADSFRATEIFYRSAGKWRETDHHWETIQIGISTTTSSLAQPQIIIFISLLLSFSFSLSFSLLVTLMLLVDLRSLWWCLSEKRFEK